MSLGDILIVNVEGSSYYYIFKITLDKGCVHNIKINLSEGDCVGAKFV